MMESSDTNASIMICFGLNIEVSWTAVGRSHAITDDAEGPMRMWREGTPLARISRSRNACIRPSWSKFRCGSVRGLLDVLLVSPNSTQDVWTFCRQFLGKWKVPHCAVSTYQPDQSSRHQ